jgi:hypothetical protein
VRKRQRLDAEKRNDEATKRARQKEYTTSKAIQRCTKANSAYSFLKGRELGIPRPSHSRALLETMMMNRDTPDDKFTEDWFNDGRDYTITSFAQDDELGVSLVGVAGGAAISVLWTSTDTSRPRPDHPLDGPRCFLLQESFPTAVTSVSMQTESDGSTTTVVSSAADESHPPEISVQTYKTTEDWVIQSERKTPVRIDQGSAFSSSTVSRYTRGCAALAARAAVCVVQGPNIKNVIWGCSDCLSVEFLGPFTLASGHRDGLIA